MNGFAFTYLVLILLDTAIHVAKDGQPRGPYSAKNAVAGLAVCMGLLWFGGFWS